MKNSTLLILGAIAVGLWLMFRSKMPATTVPAAASTGTVGNAPYYSFAQALGQKGNSALNSRSTTAQNGVGASVDLTGAATALGKGVSDFFGNLFSKSKPANPVRDPAQSKDNSPNRIPAYTGATGGYDETPGGSEAYDRYIYSQGVDTMMNGPTETYSGSEIDASSDYEDSYNSTYDATLV